MCLIRISDANDCTIYDTSDEVFTILEYWWPYPDCWDYATQCHGDYDADNDVDTVDWPHFRDNFGRTPASDCLPGDINYIFKP